MESQRSFLLIALAAVSFLLWTEWQTANQPEPVPSVQQASTSEAPVATQSPLDSSSSIVPQTNDLPPQVSSTQNRLITVTSNDLVLKIDPLGGDVTEAKLLNYKTEQGGDIPFTMFNRDRLTFYTAQSGLIGRDGPDSDGRPLYSAEQYEYDATEQPVTIPLTLFVNGMTVTKTLTVAPNGFLIKVSHDVFNDTDQPLQVRQFGQLNQTLTTREGGMFDVAYRGSAYSTSEQLYEKLDFSDYSDDSLDVRTEGGWIAMIQHYFVSAWVPPQAGVNKLYSKDLNGEKAIIGFYGDATDINAKSSVSLTSELYVGPKDQAYLKTLAKGLDLSVDYGIFYWLAQPLFWLMTFIYGFVQNWGFAIIGVTIIVKGGMYFLTKKQYESMAKMRKIQPKIEALKQRFGDDRQKMGPAMMELYRKEKVNPMGGCLPVLVQMPIFLSLYWVILESVEFRHADFILWINDLTAPDPYFILPVLTGASMFFLQKMTPMVSQDPMQAKIMQFMPIMFAVMSIFFPAGLVLYWTVQNTITLIQAKMIYAAIDKQDAKKSS